MVQPRSMRIRRPPSKSVAREVLRADVPQAKCHEMRVWHIEVAIRALGQTVSVTLGEQTGAPEIEQNPTTACPPATCGDHPDHDGEQPDQDRAQSEVVRPAPATQGPQSARCPRAVLTAACPQSVVCGTLAVRPAQGRAPTGTEGAENEQRRL